MAAVSRGVRARIGWSAIVIALAAPWAPVAEAAPGPSAPVVPAREVRTVHTNEFGLPRPGGIAYDPARDELLVAGNAPGSTRLLRLDRDETLRSSTPLPAGDPGSLTFDPTDGTVNLQSREDLVAVPAGATVDGDGDRIVLDAEGPALRVVDPEAAPPVLLEDLAGVSLRGLAYNRADGLLYVGSPDEQRLYGLDGDGNLQTVSDYADSDIVDLQAMTFAPSSDTTDDPATMHLFAADAGDEGTLGGVTELTLEPAPAIVAAIPSASLIQTIETSQFAKPSPDPSGVTYLPGPDRLLLVDSEVEETTGAGQADTNLWQLSRAGAVDHTGSTLAYSDEPTGVDHDAAGDRLFITDDTQDRVYIVTKGVDGLFGTPDDGVSELRPGKYGATDTEDPEFDPVSGDLFFLDGVSAEIYRVDPANGVFGDGDDVVTHFDVGQHGILHAEALGLHPDRGTLFVGERQGSEKRVYEITKDGQLVQVIDVSAATSLRRISGLAYAPSSTDPAVGSLWIVDRGVDNDTTPDENDGQLFELSYPEGGNTPPTVTITAPADGTSVTGGHAVTLEAQAVDPEDGDLTAAVAWESDIDGTLGTGGRITATLSSGTHQVTASVTDTGGVTDSATISVVVTSWSPSVRITAPEDGARVPGTDPVVLEGTATDPEDGDLTSAAGYASRRGGLVPGISSESPNTPGPFVDGNGNLYFFNEGDGARATARRSTDGGDTWVEVDAANQPVINDLESIDAVQVDDTLYLFNNEGDRGHLHAFNMSSHPTAPDRWVIRDEPVEEGYAYAGEQQTAALEHRSDGTFVAFYNKGDGGRDRLYYRVRSAAGSWGPVRDLEVRSGTQWLSVTTVMGADDRIHVFYRGEGDAEGLHHRSLTATGTLSAPELVSPDVSHLAWPMAGAIARIDGDTEVVQVVYQGGDDRLYVATVTDDGLPGAPTPVTSDVVAVGDTFGSHQVVATVDTIGDRSVVIYADAATRDVWYTARTGDGPWSAAQELLDDVNVFWVRGRTVRRDGSTQLGFVFDEHTGGRADRGTYAALWPRGLQWHSDRDGLLGVGAPLTTMLSADATHRITAAVTDSDGVTRSDAITLHVDSLPEPSLVNNAGLSVAEGATGTIEAAQLETSDGRSAPDELTYTLDGAPANGLLTRAGTALSVGDTFTQADINGSRLAYAHDGSETDEDSFAFTVANEYDNTVSGSLAITVTPVADPPAVTTNLGLTLAEGAARTVGTARLETTDPDTPADALTYTLDGAPANGLLTRAGTALSVGDTFTQADVDRGRVRYAHDGSETEEDGFAFTVADEDDNRVSGSFAITVTPAGDAPAVTTNLGLTLAEGSTETVGTARLETTDPDTPPDALTYTVDTSPAHGVLTRAGTALFAGDTFTQADVDRGRVRYGHDGSETEEDGFAFTVADGDGNRVSDSFAIRVTPVADPSAITLDIQGGEATIDSEELERFSAEVTGASHDTEVTWNFGDGSARVQGTEVTHRYEGTGTYVVTATATDPAGGTALDTMRVTVVDTGRVIRLSGTDRVGTAVAVARAHWSRAETVLLATSETFPDALAASALAAMSDAPLLLTPGNALPREVLDVLADLDTRTVRILGGGAAISDAIEDDLRGRGYRVDRVAGADRFETAAHIAEQVGASGGLAVIALGAHAEEHRAWPDALSAGSYAALESPPPVLLTTGGAVPDVTMDTLKALGVQRIDLLGGTVAVSRAVETQLTVAGYSVTRVSGSDRYATSLEVAERVMERLPAGQVPLVFATGENFPDGLTAGALAGRVTGPVALAHPAKVPGSIAELLRAATDRFDRADLLGGTQAISEAVRTELEQRMTP